MTLWTLLVPIAASSPEPFAACEELQVYYVAQPRPRPEERPTLWWVDPASDPCPTGARLAGAPPPSGRWIACQDPRGRGDGWRTEFGGDGKVLMESTWERSEEVGPRTEWDPVTYEVLRITALRDGRQDGETAEWLPDGGVLVTTWNRGLRDGPTWRLDARGGLMMVESWEENERHGRSCTWREGRVPIEQVYNDGQPATQ